jgi:hypothetical protein
MRLRAFLLVVVALSMTASRTASARDTRLQLPIQAVFARPDAQKKLDPTIRLYFGNAPHPAPEAELGDFTVEKKTRSLARSDEGACQVALLTALIELQQHARAVGANAVVGISSHYKDDTLVSDTEYVCGAGGMVAGTGLTGKNVRLPVKR